MLLATHSVAALHNPNISDIRLHQALYVGVRFRQNHRPRKGISLQKRSGQPVNCNTCTHGGGDANFLDVHAFA